MPPSTMPEAPAAEPPPRIGVWVAVTVAAWHLAFFATGAVTLSVATSPARTVFEGLAEPVHQKLLLTTHLRVLGAYLVVALGALALAYPAVRLWMGGRPVTRWGVAARTLLVLSLLLTHGWLRLAHIQPYFLGPQTYETWYFRALTAWPEEVRERILFVLFTFLPGVAAAAAVGFYGMVAARWFRLGGRMARVTLATAGTAAVLTAGWLVAPHFIQGRKADRDDRMNVVLLSSDEVGTMPASPEAAARQPHLATLAAESVVLTNMHTPLTTKVAGAATLHTGQPPHTHGLQTPYPSAERVNHLLSHAPLLPSLLQAHGYTTVLLGDAAAAAFATAGGLGFGEVDAGSDEAYPHHLAGTVYPAHLVIPAWLDNRLGRRLLPGLNALPNQVSPEQVTERLTARLEQGAANGTPFFLQAVYSEPAAAPAAAPSPPPASSFDQQLARVIESLEANGLRQNTIVVVLGRPPTRPTTTEPPSAASQPPQKTDTLVPVLFHVPGHAFPPGEVSQLSRLFDLAPTLLEILGLPPVPAMEGVSLRPVLENPATPLALAVFGESPGFLDQPPSTGAPAAVRAAFREGIRLEPSAGYRLVLRDEPSALRRKSRWLRTARWQLVFTPAETSSEEVDQWQLFDVQSDPGLTRDVKLQNPAVWTTLEIALRRWADDRKETRLTEIFPNGEPPAVVLPGT